MESDLRSTLQHLAPKPERGIDVSSLVRVGRRRRRNRLLAYSVLSVVIAGTLGVVTPKILRASGSHHPVAPVHTPNMEPSPGRSDIAFNDLPTGWTKLPWPPSVRTEAATVWGSDRLFVWGGIVYTGLSGEPPLSDGFLFDARSRTWSRIPPAPLPPRVLPASVWTGKEFLVWGGRGGDAQQPGFYGDGAAYNPATDSWRKLPPAPIGGRAPVSVWTGREFIVWGNRSRVQSPRRDGAAYDPATNTWRKISPAPIGLTDAVAVWTGHEMIVFGAVQDSGNVALTATAIGAAFNPESDTWRQLPASNLSPQASTAAWDGHELIAWDYLNHSAAYNRQAGKWWKLPHVPLPPAECVPQSVSVEWFVVGDYCGATVVYNPADRAWHDVSRNRFAGWGFTLAPANRVVLLLGGDAETKEKAMFAYRPPKSFKP